ncbi:hypothetical protein HDU86_006840 [Geranomyces michiganensis]|nr:hypothetical protein HDU86_006840 [Geranomyces michiganensis]
MLRDQLDGPKRHPKLSLQLARLNRAVKSSFCQLTTLAEICRCNISPNPTSPRHAHFAIPLGSELLSRIYDAACVLDAIIAPDRGTKSATMPARSPTVFLRAVLHVLLEHSARPYLAWLEQWLGVRAAAHVPPGALADVAGALERITDVWDPYAEFYVAWEETEGPAGGGGFWNGEWQMSPDVEPPSFLPQDIAQDVLHAGKCLRLLRACQPDHPLVEGAAEVNFGLQWCFLSEDIDKHTAAANAYVAHNMDRIAAARESELAAVREAARIKDAEAQKRREDAAALKANKAESAAAARKAIQARKEQERSSVESFLKDLLASKKAARDAQTVAESEAERKRLEDERARLQAVEEERQKMMARHEKKMRDLDKKAEKLEWKRMRVALNAKRKEVIRVRESKEWHAVVAPDYIDAGDKQTSLDASRRDGIGLTDGASKHHETVSGPAMFNQEPSPRPDIKLHSQGPAIFSPHIAAMGAETAEALRAFSPSESLAPPINSHPPLPPTFAEMQPISMLLGAAPSNFSPFFAPGIGADLDDGHPSPPPMGNTDSFESTPGQETVSPTAPGTGALSTISPAGTAEVIHGDANMLLVDESTASLTSSEISRSHYAAPSAESSAQLNIAPSFAHLLESHLASAPSAHSFDAALSYMTAHTLHASLRDISALISKAAVKALRPGLRAHLTVARRFLLLNDAAFLSRVVDALYSRRSGMGFAGSGIDVDGRPSMRWPPSFGEMVEALDGVVGPTEDEWGALEFVGGGGGRDAGAIDALANLRLRYKAPAPYDMVIGTVAVEKYGRTFEFLMLLQRARVALDRVVLSEWWRRRGKWENDSERFWAAWSAKDTKSASRLYFEARAFVAGVTRHSFDTVNAPDVWSELDVQLADDDDGGPRALSEVHGTHDAAIDALLWRLLLRPKQRPVMAIIEGMLQIAVRFARRACGVDSWKNGGGNGGEAAALLSAFQIRYAMLVKVLKGMVERDVGVAGKDVEGFRNLLTEIDGNGFVAKEIVPRLATLQNEADALA